MAHNAGGARPGVLVTLPGSVLEDDVSEAEVDPADLHEEIDDFGQIDKLLQATDEGWGLDEQVISLQQVAAHTQPATTGVEVELVAKPSQPPPRKLPPPPPPSAPGTRPPEPSPVRAPADMADAGALVDLLHARLATLETSNDAVGLARLHMELAIASEFILGDDVRATAHAEAALRASPTSSAAHAMLRRRKHGRTTLAAMLAHLEEELTAATSEATKVELLAEKARLLEASGSGDVRGTWEQALTFAPHHAAALKGLEAELYARAGTLDTLQDWEVLTLHLGRMADSYTEDAHLAAWLHVERAHILETKLGRVDAARGALERALQLDVSVGPVRTALVRHAATHADWPALTTLLEDEARLESSAARAARLELDAAAIAVTRLGDRMRACELLERAAARAPTSPEVDRRVLDDLVRLHEADGRWAEAARARRSRLRFITDPAAIAYELRALASAAEQGGDLDAAVADVQRALALDATDPTLVEMLDRLLATAGKHEQRIATWLQEAARTEDATARGRAFVRAARICDTIGRHTDATRHLRSAWISSPGDPEVLDALARQLSPILNDAAGAGARSLVELYAQAADLATDESRKIAFLEKVALLWEDVLGDPARAARTYEQVLEIDSARRGAIVGLQRTSARTDDVRTLARSLLEEARLTTDGPTRVSLRTRAAQALEHQDAPRAIALVREVLAEEPSNAVARSLETRLEEQAGRWEMAARSVRARVDLAENPAQKVALWLALAQMQSARLHKPLEALASLQQARTLDPAHPVPPAEIARVLEDHGDPRALRDAVERLASSAPAPEERARHLVRAAEIDELRLNEDASAIRTYRRLLGDAPSDDFIAERLARVAVRGAGRGDGHALAELAPIFARRIEQAAAPDVARGAALDLATLLLEREPAQASALIEATLAASPGHRGDVPTLRMQETLQRRAKDSAGLARVLAQQGEELADVRARLGALWNLATLEEWKPGLGDVLATYRRILELDPTDPGALEATVRIEMLSARRGDPRSRKSLAGALRALVPFAADDETRLMLQLRLAMLLEATAQETPEGATELLREALDRYADALQIDDSCVTAASGSARLAGRLDASEAALAASRALAELATDPRVKARYFVKAAELLTTDDNDDPEAAPAARKQAAELLERALTADPDSIAAAAKLGAVLIEDGQEERLVTTFRSALSRAKSPDAVVMLGAEVARVARDELKDLTVAIDAMRRVRTVAPQHVPSLLTLAELCIAQRVWPEAVDALEAVVSIAREATPKLTALFALASVYEKVLRRPDHVERVLRAALVVDPYNARALSGLLRRLATEAPASHEQAQRARRLEIANLLHRLADVEKDPDKKSGILLELADVHLRLSDAAAAERALVEAVATAPSHTRAFARLASFFKRPEGRDAVGYARALTAVVSMGQQLGRVDARWLAVLGQLEVGSLSRLRDGITHLSRAAQIDATLYETRFELASAYARMGAHDEAWRALVAMLTPSPRPILSVADPPAALMLLEQSFSSDRRGEEAVVVSELRALAGEIDEGRRAWLLGRVVRPGPDPEEVLDRPTLVTHVLPPEGRHILLEVAAAIAGIEAKMLRMDLGELGVSSRDRLTARSGHPMRLMLDRVAKQLGVGEVEIVISPAVVRPRVVAQDVPWIVVPPALTQRGEAAQLATLARATARIAYGVPWLEEMAPAHIEAFLVAAARQVVPGYAADRIDPVMANLVAQQEAGVGRALARRQRKLLDELAPHIASPQARPLPIETFLGALARAELRAAFLVTGQLLAVVEEVRVTDEVIHRLVSTPSINALAAVLEHPMLGDVTRYALTSEATALRRGLGSTWTG
jgi:tetratricopeptide (TPR) repeat protein